MDRRAVNRGLPPLRLQFPSLNSSHTVGRNSRETGHDKQTDLLPYRPHSRQFNLGGMRTVLPAGPVPATPFTLIRGCWRC